MRDSSIRTYRDKMRQANREARATVVALACIVVVWFVGGFGLAGCDIWVFHTPLWVVGGCIAPWIAAIVAAVVLSRRVFADFDLDDAADAVAGTAADAPARPDAPAPAGASCRGEAHHE